MMVERHVKENKKTYTSVTKADVKVRDRLGNISNEFTLNGVACFNEKGENQCYINKVDDVGPQIKYEVIEGSKQTSNNEWYTSGQVVIKVTIVDKIKKINDKNEIVIVDGGVGINNETVNISSDNKNAIIDKKSDSIYMITMNENGIYNITLEAEDLLGNKSNGESITIKKDSATPSISLKTTLKDYTTSELSSNISAYFNSSYGVSSGSITCKDVSTNKTVKTINDVYNLGKSTREVQCTITGNNGLYASAKTGASMAMISHTLSVITIPLMYYLFIELL